MGRWVDDRQKFSHPLQVSLEGFFKLRAEAVRSGLVWEISDAGEVWPAEPSGPTPRVEDLEGGALLDYVLAPWQTSGLKELGLAAGGATNNRYDYDFYEWEAEVARMSADRINQWESAYGEIPFPRAKAYAIEALG